MYILGVYTHTHTARRSHMASDDVNFAPQILAKALPNLVDFLLFILALLFCQLHMCGEGMCVWCGQRSVDAARVRGQMHACKYVCLSVLFGMRTYSLFAPVALPVHSFDFEINLRAVPQGTRGNQGARQICQGGWHVGPDPARVDVCGGVRAGKTKRARVRGARGGAKSSRGASVNKLLAFRSRRRNPRVIPVRKPWYLHLLLDHF